jgi:hypothetical protein
LGKKVAGIHDYNHHHGNGVGVLWIALHPSFELSTREFNLAVVGLTYPLQFHAHLYQICLPSGSYSDSNAGKIQLYI